LSCFEDLMELRGAVETIVKERRERRNAAPLEGLPEAADPPARVEPQ